MTSATSLFPNKVTLFATGGLGLYTHNSTFNRVQKQIDLMEESKNLKTDQ